VGLPGTGAKRLVTGLLIVVRHKIGA
jgi:hypothetical protein